MRVALVATLALVAAGGWACGEPSLCEQLGAERGCIAQRNAAYSCVGGDYRETSCGTAAACVEGECRPRICDPIDFGCVRGDQVAETCVDGGTRVQRVDCAAAGQVCVVEPLTARCLEQACVPGRVFCAPDGSEVRKCSTDGRSYDVVQACRATPDAVSVGATCVGARCVSRCELVEATETSTRGCAFVAAPPGSGSFQVLVGNSEPDLTAQVRVTCAAQVQLVNVMPLATVSVDCATMLPSGTSAGYRSLFVEATSPVEVWAIPMGGAGVAIPPRHTLGTEHRVGWGVDGAQRLLVAAASDGEVTIDSAVAFDAGGSIAALPAGGTMTRMMGRGDVLALARTGAIRGVRVTSTVGVTVVLEAQPGAAVLVPPSTALGRAWVAPTGTPATVTALEPLTVTSEREGTRALADGESTTVAGGQVVRADGRGLVVAAGVLVPPIEQLRTRLLFPRDGRLVLYAPQAQVVTVGSSSVALTAHPGASGATATFDAITVGGAAIVGPQALGGWLVAGGVTLPLGSGVGPVP